MASVRFDRYRFSKTVMRKFAFVGNDYGLKRRDLGMADEFMDRYTGEDIAVTIALSYPGLPLVTVARRKPTDATYRYRESPHSPAAKLKARYYTRLKKNPTPHQELQVMQLEYADIVARDVGAVLMRLERNPRTPPGRRWVLLSHRFPA